MELFSLAKGRFSKQSLSRCCRQYLMRSHQTKRHLRPCLLLPISSPPASLIESLRTHRASQVGRPKPQSIVRMTINGGGRSLTTSDIHNQGMVTHAVKWVGSLLICVIDRTHRPRIGQLDQPVSFSQCTYSQYKWWSVMCDLCIMYLRGPPPNIHVAHKYLCSKKKTVFPQVCSHLPKL